MAMESISNRRLRLNFKDQTILNKTQKKQGLKRSWLLLKPHHHTINDVVLDILRGFNLAHTCPHGILLSMDGFVLPPFESTSILKDKDLVSVKRKALPTKAIVESRPFLVDEIVEKQPLPSGVRLLANEEFDNEKGGCESETDVGEVEAEEPVQSAQGGDVASRKRKASSPIESSKKKRLGQAMQKSVQKKDNNHCENIKRPQKKRKLVDGSNCEVTLKCTNNSEPRSNELEEKQEVTAHASSVSDGAKKTSRRTLRKRMKRYWKKVGATNNNEDEKQLAVKKFDKVSGSKKTVDTNISKIAEEDSDTDDDLVPVEIRPGHIRFAPASKAKDVQKDQEANGWGVQEKQEAPGSVIQKNQEENGWGAHSAQKSAWGDHSAQKNHWDADKDKVAKETFCWNGITNKRKGQKWGKENQQSSWKESRDCNGQSSNSRAINNQPNSSWKQRRDHNNQSCSTWGSKRKQLNDASLNFEKLMPLTDSPKVGDIIAYRLLELSSSWCPELTSFRVGKVTSYDQETNNIMLVPQAEYPLNLEKKVDNDDEDSGQPPQPSVYKEDGSLEIDFLSLTDVRVVKTGDPNYIGGTEVPAANGTPGSSGTSKGTNQVEDKSKNGPSDTGNQELNTSTPGKKDVWEEISDALSAKKAQLLQEDAWSKKQNSSKRTWSHRTLKSSALGPTMAMLRSQNGGAKKP